MEDEFTSAQIPQYPLTFFELSYLSQFYEHTSHSTFS